jgi:hypothetical protein
MIGWITDNPLSRTVMESISWIDDIRHINDFKLHHSPQVFYGILRGCSHAMRIIGFMKSADYYYIDNGYFDALYVDKSMHKSMEGKFRVVKNGMHKVYPYGGSPDKPQRILVIPPSPYSANFYDTTPEDWTASLQLGGKDVLVRSKECRRTLQDDLAWCDGVLSFNSMAVMSAIGLGKSVSDTHGIFRKPGFYKYDIAKLKEFYEPRQFTLQELREGKCRFT